MFAVSTVVTDKWIFTFSQNPTRLECISFVVLNSSVDFEKTDASLLDAYSDSTLIPDNKKQMVAAAIEHGIINGYTDKTLRPAANVTRAEFACMIHRAKEWFMPGTELVAYTGSYPDLSDWNRMEIAYCIQNGYLMGYGDRFGSDDLIEDWQMLIIANRLMYGLTTREKYSFLNVCGVSPVPYNDMLNSAYDPVLASSSNQAAGLEPDTSIDTETAADMLTAMLDKIGNEAPDRLLSETYREYVRSDFLQSSPNGKIPYSIVYNGTYTNIDTLIAQTQSFGTERESIHVLSPDNTRVGRILTGYRVRKGVGYEYFMYSGKGAVPEGFENGKWYRRRFSAEYTESVRSTHSSIFYVSYGDAEAYN